LPFVISKLLTFAIVMFERSLILWSTHRICITFKTLVYSLQKTHCISVTKTRSLGKSSFFVLGIIRCINKLWANAVFF
jgi:hypothetical protein